MVVGARIQVNLVSDFLYQSGNALRRTEDADGSLQEGQPLVDGGMPRYTLYGAQVGIELAREETNKDVPVRRLYGLHKPAEAGFGISAEHGTHEREVRHLVVKEVSRRKSPGIWKIEYGLGYTAGKRCRQSINNADTGVPRDPRRYRVRKERQNNVNAPQIATGRSPTVGNVQWHKGQESDMCDRGQNLGDKKIRQRIAVHHPYPDVLDARTGVADGLQPLPRDESFTLHTLCPPCPHARDCTKANVANQYTWRKTTVFKNIPPHVVFPLRCRLVETKRQNVEEFRNEE